MKVSVSIPIENVVGVEKLALELDASSEHKNRIEVRLDDRRFAVDARLLVNALRRIEPQLFALPLRSPENGAPPPLVPLPEIVAHEEKFEAVFDPYETRHLRVQPSCLFRGREFVVEDADKELVDVDAFHVEDLSVGVDRQIFSFDGMPLRALLMAHGLRLDSAAPGILIYMRVRNLSGAKQYFKVTLRGDGIGAASSSSEL